MEMKGAVKSVEPDNEVLETSFITIHFEYLSDQGSFF